MANGHGPENPFRRIWLSVKLRVGQIFYDLQDVQETTMMTDTGAFDTQQLRILHPLGCGHCADAKSVCKYGEPVCRTCSATCALCSSPVCRQTLMPGGPHSFTIKDGRILCRDCYKTWAVEHALAAEENMALGFMDSIEKLFRR